MSEEEEEERYIFLLYIGIFSREAIGRVLVCCLRVVVLGKVGEVYEQSLVQLSFHSSSDEKQKVSKKKTKKSESPSKIKAARHRSVSSSSAHRYEMKELFSGIVKVQLC